MRWLPLLLVACLKTEPQRVAPSPIAVRVLTVLGNVDDDEVTSLPETTQEVIFSAMEDRRLTPRSDGEVLAVFLERRSWASRLEALGRAPVEPILLVACDARFDTQVNGRFRWQVECDLAMGADEPRVLGHLSAPAHLVYYHQKQADAVGEVQGALGREVGQVLDQWLAQTL